MQRHRNRHGDCRELQSCGDAGLSDMQRMLRLRLNNRTRPCKITTTASLYSSVCNLSHGSPENSSNVSRWHIVQLAYGHPPNIYNKLMGMRWGLIVQVFFDVWHRIVYEHAKISKSVISR
jgi:hypothetical protein